MLKKSAQYKTDKYKGYYEDMNIYLYSNGEKNI